MSYYFNRPPTYPVRPAFQLLGQEPAGIAIDFLSNECAIIDPSNPTNNYLGSITSGPFTYTGPTTKSIFNAFGTITSVSAFGNCQHDPLTLSNSTDSLTSFTGVKTLVVDGNATYVVGQVVRITLASDITKWMLGKVTNWVVGTRTLTVNVYANSGIFDGNNWKVIVAQGYLPEPQRINLIRYSNNLMGPAGWAISNPASGLTIAPGDPSIFGGTLFTVTAGSSAADYRQANAITPNSQIAISVSVKRGNQPLAVFQYHCTGGTGTQVTNVQYNFDTDTLAVTSNNMVIGYSKRTIYPNGEVVIEFSATTSNDGPTAYILLHSGRPNGDSTQYGRVQYEYGAYATSFIPTGASQVTRAGDNFSVNNNQIPKITGTCTVAAKSIAVNTPSSRLVTLNSGGINEIRICTISSGQWQRAIITNNITQANILNPPNSAVGMPIIEVLSSSQNNIIGASNLGQYTPDTVADVFTDIFEIYIGCWGSLFQYGQPIAEVTLLPRAISQTECNIRAGI